MSWRLEKTCCHSDFSERPSANSTVKNSQRIIIIIRNIVSGHYQTSRDERDGRESFLKPSSVAKILLYTHNHSHNHIIIVMISQSNGPCTNSNTGEYTTHWQANSLLFRYERLTSWLLSSVLRHEERDTFLNHSILTKLQMLSRTPQTHHASRIV